MLCEPALLSTEGLGWVEGWGRVGYGMVGEGRLCSAHCRADSLNAMRSALAAVIGLDIGRVLYLLLF